MSKIRLWFKDLGGCSITRYDFSKKPESETDNEFIYKIDSSLIKQGYDLSKSLLMEEEEVKDIDQSDKFTFLDGKIVIDSSIKTDGEKLSDAMSVAIQELKDKGISDSTIKLILR